MRIARQKQEVGKAHRNLSRGGRLATQVVAVAIFIDVVCLRRTTSWFSGSVETIMTDLGTEVYSTLLAPSPVSYTHLTLPTKA